MPISTLAVARLYRRDPTRVRELYDTPALLWRQPARGLKFDEFAPRLTHDLGAPSELDDPDTEPGVKDPAILFQVRKSDAAADSFWEAVTIGRSLTNDVHIDHRSVSRFHAFLRRNEADQWIVIDSGSRNGTFVDGVRLEPKESRSVRSGSVLRFGQVQLQFVDRDALFNELERELASA